jgi:hypothetical protein
VTPDCKCGCAACAAGHCEGCLDLNCQEPGCTECKSANGRAELDAALLGGYSATCECDCEACAVRACAGCTSTPRRCRTNNLLARRRFKTLLAARDAKHFANFQKREARKEKVSGYLDTIASACGHIFRRRR